MYYTYVHTVCTLYVATYYVCQFTLRLIFMMKSNQIHQCLISLLDKLQGYYSIYVVSIYISEWDTQKEAILENLLLHLQK